MDSDTVSDIYTYGFTLRYIGFKLIKFRERWILITPHPDSPTHRSARVLYGVVSIGHSHTDFTIHSTHTTGRYPCHDSEMWVQLQALGQQGGGWWLRGWLVWFG